MSRTRMLRWSAALASVLALSAVAAQASRIVGATTATTVGSRSAAGRHDRLKPADHVQRQATRRIRDARVDHRPARRRDAGGIDFRPASGALYGVGTDKSSTASTRGPASRSPRARRSRRHSTASRSASTSTRPSTRSASSRTRRRTCALDPDAGHRRAEREPQPGMPHDRGRRLRELVSSAPRRRPRPRCTWSTRRTTGCSRRTRRTTARSRPRNLRVQGAGRLTSARTPASTSRARATSAS